MANLYAQPLFPWPRDAADDLFKNNGVGVVSQWFENVLRYGIVLHIDIAEPRARRGKIRLFVAMDRPSKCTCVGLREKADKVIAAQFLRNPIAAVPHKAHTILTDNCIRFTHRKQGTTA